MINDNFLCKSIEKTNSKQLYLFHNFTIDTAFTKTVCHKTKKRSQQTSHILVAEA